LITTQSISLALLLRLMTRGKIFKDLEAQAPARKKLGSKVALSIIKVCFTTKWIMPQFKKGNLKVLLGHLPKTCLKQRWSISNLWISFRHKCNSQELKTIITARLIVKLIYLSIMRQLSKYQLEILRIS
jgi:hypothetical protein